MREILRFITSGSILDIEILSPWTHVSGSCHLGQYRCSKHLKIISLREGYGNIHALTPITAPLHSGFTHVLAASRFPPHLSLGRQRNSRAGREKEACRWGKVLLGCTCLELDSRAKTKSGQRWSETGYKMCLLYLASREMKIKTRRWRYFLFYHIGGDFLNDNPF